MSYAQGTTHYNFPQIAGTDRPTFADANEAFRTLDTKIYSLEGSATDVDGRLDTAEGNIVQLQSDVQTAQGTANLAKSTADTAVEQIGITNTNVSQLTTHVGNKFDSVGIADPYDTAATYAVGDVVTYNGQRYRCTTAVTVAEPFDVTKWIGEDVETVLERIESVLSPVVLDVSTLKSTVNANEAGNRVSLTHNQTYRAPSDGYIEIQSSTSSNPGGVSATLYGSNGTSVIGYCNEPESPTSTRQYLIYIKKGMIVKATIYGNASVKFTPITS